MRSFLLGIFFLLLANSNFYAQEKVDFFDFYFDETENFDPTIKTPKEFLGYVPGEQHLSHDQLVYYLNYLAENSPRLSIENRGYTYENRPLLLLYATSAENQLKLNEIKDQREKVERGEFLKDFLVIYQGYLVHGNEQSAVGAALIYAYYLAASQNPDLINVLAETVVLLDPSLNPDGQQRFSNWVNQHKSEHLNTDPQDREHREVWPGGRTNHYWFDLNRDWLPIVHPSSQARIKTFQDWKPHVLTDHHEMYPNSTYFFQPGIPDRTHPLTMEKNQELTEKIGEYHAQFLDQEGSLYYSKESFDDFYYGKGSTYPDINGSVGILFEQASSRGLHQSTDFGILSYPYTIKNQLLTSLSSLYGAYDLKDELATYQQEFYNKSLQASNEAYVFSKPKDDFLTYELAKKLMHHGIEVYQPKENQEINGKKFLASSSFIVPKRQGQSQLVEAFFEDRTEFKDSLFYDVSAWSFKHAYGLEFETTNFSMAVELVEDLKLPKKKSPSKSNYAYLIHWEDFQTPAVAYQLMDAGLFMQFSLKAFEADGEKFDRGSLLLPIQNQKMEATAIHELVKQLNERFHINIKPVSSGNTQGINLGSPNFKKLNQPKVAMLVGDGVYANDAGEIWYNLDYLYEMPVTKLDVNSMSRHDLSKYTHLIVPNAYGSFLNSNETSSLKDWVQNGGHLIAFRNAVNWLENLELINVERKPTDLDTSALTYEDRSPFYGAQRIGGSIFEVELDLSHPLNFGFQVNKIASFRNTTVFLEKDEKGFSNPVVYSHKPLLSGYISKENLELLKNTSAVKIQNRGRGKIIYFTDNPLFRGYWKNTSRFFMNALFFSSQF